ncbi:TIGR02186 family protein [Mesorhizobium sp. CAU 1732]|uniref:TIGR02186 family protein n=1 Tax=Mesorhizobium sp. CAU 1732 TaxID=3140358 RepID=UPI003260CE4F
MELTRSTLPTLAAAFLMLAMGQARAQAPEIVNPEAIQIGLSTDRVSITADFSGADLTIFGALENADPLVTRQGRYDVIVVLEGPPRPIVVRKKNRILGMWVNTESETFVNVPVSYSVATTRSMQDITNPKNFKQLALGADNLTVTPLNKAQEPATLAEFTAALRERKKATGLYSERIGGVNFLSQSLFRATLHLAPNVPVGTHRARAFLFKNGVFIKESSAQLAILKAGFEERLFRIAQNNSFLFGLAAVALAFVTGWLGRLIFRKD